MAGPALDKSAVSWAFDGAVMAAGMSVGLLAVVGMLSGQRFDVPFTSTSAQSSGQVKRIVPGVVMSTSVPQSCLGELAVPLRLGT